MDNSQKKAVLQRLTTRVSTGLTFIEFNYLNSHPTPDAAWIRNIYLLLSFYTELLLKAICANEKEYENLETMDESFQALGHNLEKIGSELGQQAYAKYGINKIAKTPNHEYFISTDVADFNVKDFTDIRYDFLDDRVRTLTGKEHEMFKAQITAMEDINAVLKVAAWS